MILEAKNISKSFPGVQALNNVSFGLEPGEIHAIIGENGAGKSTLMHILAGIYKHDKGEFFIDNKRIELDSFQKAKLQGIAIVFQERSLFPNLSIAENIFGSNPPRNKKLFFQVDWSQLSSLAQDYLDKLNITLNKNELVGELSVARQQMIEIAKAISNDFKILILDEPTSSITLQETEILFELIKQFKSEGRSIIYISHRLKEIKQIADRVTVLKDGEYVGTFDQKNVDVDFLVSKMLGKDLENEKFNNQVNQNKEKVLSIKKLSGEGFSDISFDLHKGEILTLTGLSGAGRTELAYSLFGFIPSKSGEIFVNNKKTIIDSTSKAIKNGIGYLSENRKELGLFTGMEYRENIESNNLDKFSKNFIINKSKRDSVAEDLKIKFDIKIPKIDHLVLNLSGGNQQKVSISKWIYANLKILIVDEPTIGVDVGAKFSIYKILKEITSEGVSVLMISSDINETLNISDRIIVMFDGKISGILNAEEANEEKILKMASGIDNE